MDFALDPLAAALGELKLRCEPLAGPPCGPEGWRRTFPLDAVSLHLVVIGDCLIGADVKLWRYRLERGEVLVVNRGVPGELRPTSEHGHPPEVLSMRVHLDAQHGHPLVDALPPLIRATPGILPRSFGPSVDALLGEISVPSFGRDAILERLSEVLFIQALRVHLSDLTWYDQGWFRALVDPVLRGHLHWAADPQGSVSSLARAIARSTRRLSARFSQFAGSKPSEFLRDARLRRAAELLRQGESDLQRIAALTGYGSRQALARAFRRRFGVSPTGYWRTTKRRPFPRARPTRGDAPESRGASPSGGRDPAEPE